MVNAVGGPVLFDDGNRPYRPERDLAPIAASLAEAIERDGTYVVGGIGIAVHVPLAWVGAAAEVLDRLTGCGRSMPGHFRPRPGSREHFPLAYVAEADRRGRRPGRRGREAGRAGSLVTGFAPGRLVAVVIAACVLADQPTFENDDSLARFDQPIAVLLAE